MTPLPRLCCISFFVRDAHACGWRDVVILAYGRKWVRGFTAATLEPVTLAVDEVKALDPEPLRYSRSRLAARLRRNAKLYPHSKTVARAIAELGRKAP